MAAPHPGHGARRCCRPGAVQACRQEQCSRGRDQPTRRARALRERVCPPSQRTRAALLAATLANYAAPAPRGCAVRSHFGLRAPSPPACVLRSPARETATVGHFFSRPGAVYSSSLRFSYLSVTASPQVSTPGKPDKEIPKSCRARVFCPHMYNPARADADKLREAHSMALHLVRVSRRLFLALQAVPLKTARVFRRSQAGPRNRPRCKNSRARQSTRSPSSGCARRSQSPQYTVDGNA